MKGGKLLLLFLAIGLAFVFLADNVTADRIVEIDIPKEIDLENDLEVNAWKTYCEDGCWADCAYHTGKLSLADKICQCEGYASSSGACYYESVDVRPAQRQMLIVNQDCGYFAVDESTGNGGGSGSALTRIECFSYNSEADLFGGCSDGLDNDADGRYDCEDTFECEGVAQNGAKCLEGRIHEDNCVDGIDNDHDNKIDLEDSDCLQQCVEDGSRKGCHAYDKSSGYTEKDCAEKIVYTELHPEGINCIGSSVNCWQKNSPGEGSVGAYLTCDSQVLRNPSDNCDTQPGCKWVTVSPDPDPNPEEDTTHRDDDVTSIYPSGINPFMKATCYVGGNEYIDYCTEGGLVEYYGPDCTEVLVKTVDHEDMQLDAAYNCENGAIQLPYSETEERLDNLFAAPESVGNWLYVLVAVVIIGVGVWYFTNNKKSQYKRRRRK